MTNFSDYLTFSTENELKTKFSGSIDDLKNVNNIKVNSDYNSYLKDDFVTPFDYLLLCKKTLHSLIENHELDRKEINSNVEKLITKFEDIIDLQENFKLDIQAIRSFIESYFSNLYLGKTIVNTHDLSASVKELEEFYSTFLMKIFFKSNGNKIYKSLLSKFYTRLEETVQLLAKEDAKLLDSIAIGFIEYMKVNSKEKTRRQDKEINSLTNFIKNYNPLKLFIDGIQKSDSKKIITDFAVREKYFAHIISVHKLAENQKNQDEVQRLEKNQLPIFPLKASLIQYDFYLNFGQNEIEDFIEIAYYNYNNSPTKFKEHLKKNTESLVKNYQMRIVNNKTLMAVLDYKEFSSTVKSKSKRIEFDKICSDDGLDNRILLISIISFIIILEFLVLLYLKCNRN